MMNWQRSSVRSYFKTVTVIIILIIIAYIFFTSQGRYGGTTAIYTYQANIADVLDLEMQYMPKYVVEDDDTWITADDLDGYIFSAYFDARPEVLLKESTIDSEGRITWAEIRIISILPFDTDPTQIECVYKFTSNFDDSSIHRYASATRVKALEEHSHRFYSAFSVICDLSHPKNYDNELIYNEKQLPESIGIRSKKSNNSVIKYADVHYPKNGMNQFYEKAEQFMALCVPVLHHEFNRVAELIEFIEYYRLMGVNHFTFYNLSITNDVKSALEFYQSNEIATVLNWHIQSLEFEGLIAAINDCLYRNTFYENYKYVAIFDIDEFLVPRKHENFSELLAELDPELLDERRDTKYASFLFKSAHFDSSYTDDSKHQTDEPYLYTEMKTKRLKTHHVARNRTRYIVRGRDVVELGNYQPWQLRPGSLDDQTKQFNEMIVEPDVALCHHYAPCEITEETDCYLKSIVIDRTAQKFANKISNKVATVCHSVFGERNCPSPIK